MRRLIGSGGDARRDAAVDADTESAYESATMGLNAEVVHEQEAEAEEEAEEEAEAEEQKQSAFSRDDEQPNAWRATLLADAPSCECVSMCSRLSNSSLLVVATARRATSRSIAWRRFARATRTRRSRCRNVCC